MPCSCMVASSGRIGAVPRATGSLNPPCRAARARPRGGRTRRRGRRARSYRSSSDGSGQGMRPATRRRSVMRAVRRLVLEPVAGAGHALDGHRREQLVGRHVDAHLELRRVVWQVHVDLGAGERASTGPWPGVAPGNERGRCRLQSEARRGRPSCAGGTITSAPPTTAAVPSWLCTNTVSASRSPLLRMGFGPNRAVRPLMLGAPAADLRDTSPPWMAARGGSLR